MNPAGFNYLSAVKGGKHTMPTLNGLMRRRNRAALMIAGILVLGMAYLFLFKTPAFVVSIDGNPVCIVKDKNEIFLEVVAIRNHYRSTYGNLADEHNKVTYERVFVSSSEVTAPGKAKELLREQLAFKVEAWAIVVDGAELAYLPDVKQVRMVLDQVKGDGAQLAEGEVLKEVSFAERVEVWPVQVETGALLDVDAAVSLLQMGKVAPQIHIVQTGDSLWSIARANDMLVADILAANPGLEEEGILNLGQEINLVMTEPYVNVLAQVEGQRTEIVPYETKVVNDPGASSIVQVKQAGVNGEKQIAYLDTRTNGAVTEHKVLSEQVTREPVESIVVKGPQNIQVASRGSSGINLSRPVQGGTITQYYKGRSHTGVDIALSTGSPIRASRGGTVVFCGWQGGYGNFIIIDHGGGVLTRYAHCSRIDVSVGQNVSMGTVIGAVGSTGKSTGPHLHFEVVVNGSFIDPLSCF